jgi:hypothetical protein
VTAVAATEARKRLYKLLDEVADSHEPERTHLPETHNGASDCLRAERDEVLA